MKSKIYIDTSVIGGCLDDEFKDDSLKLIDKFKKGEMIAVISDLTIIELQGAPHEVQNIIREIPVANKENVKLTREAEELGRMYIKENIVGTGEIVDAEHIAIATVNRVDAIVSWNFKHIVNLQRIRGYNSVNLKYGYPVLEIRTPKEVIPYEE